MARPTATASSAAADYAAAGAIDGERFSAEAGHAWRGPSGQQSWWWQVQFERPQPVAAILQIVGDDQSLLTSAPKSYVWQASDDGTNWRDLAETRTVDERRLFRLHRLQSPVSARFLRIAIAAANGEQPVLREIEFLAPGQALEFPDWFIAVNTEPSAALPFQCPEFLRLARELPEWCDVRAQFVGFDTFDEPFVAAEPRPLCAFLTGNLADWCQHDRRTWRGVQEVLAAGRLPLWASCGGAQGLAILSTAGVDSPWDCPHCRDPLHPLLPVYTHIGHAGRRACGDYSCCRFERGTNWVRAVAADPVLAGLEEEFQVMESHCGQIEFAPPGWTLVVAGGQGAQTRVQCLRRDDRPVYAAQFHIEMDGTPESSRRLMANFLAAAKAWGGYNPDAVPLDVPQPLPPKRQEALRVPPGFVVERVAGPPLVERPMLVSFDDAGRLYVCDSAGVNLRGPELAANPPHVIRVLEDVDGDGRFDTSRVFADKLVFPQGVLWHNGAVYVSSPPSFWKLTDTDGDGVADRREELVTGFANTGVADDMHGGSLGLDGRIYWCAGRFPHAIHRPDGPVIHAGHAPLILRCRPDGSELEVVCGSQGNAVGVAFGDEGDFFASGTFLAPDSLGAGLRDAVIHCVDGGVYPVRDREPSGHPLTGELLPPLVHQGVSATADLTIYRSAAFGPQYAGNLFSVLFNKHLVQRHILERAGATFRCRTEDFLTSRDSDFHPTDVCEDADGSLLIVDTGGWFRIGCPTSQLAKPDLLGGIYRIRRQDAARPLDPRGTKLRWDDAPTGELLARLDSPLPAVRERAIGELARRGGAAVGELRAVCAPVSRAVSSGPPPAQVQRGALWALARIDGAAARTAIRETLASEASTQQVAARIAGLWRDAEARRELEYLVVHGEPPVRREAATALGRIGDAQSVEPLLTALADGVDRFLEHAIIFALVQIDDRQRTAQGLASAEPAVRRGALIALDQMADGGLAAEQVLPFLRGDDPLLHETALWVLKHHPDWADAVADVFHAQLLTELTGDARRQLREQLAAFAGAESTRHLLAATLDSAATPGENRALVLEVMAGSSEPLPAAWAEPLAHALACDDEALVRAALPAARTFADRPPAKKHSKDKTPAEPDRRLALVDPLRQIATAAARPVELRIGAAAALAPLTTTCQADVFAALAAGLAAEEPLLRLQAAEALAASPLSTDQLDRLVAHLEAAGPLELPKLVAAFSRASDEALGRKLVEALGRATSGESIRAEQLREVLRDYPPSVQVAAGPLFARADADGQTRAAHLAELRSVLAGGEVQRGRNTFYSQKALCSACHTVQGQGGKIGPDLSAIGGIRSPDDLLEAIVYPSASFARGFEPFNITTTDGRTLSGIIARQSAEALVVYNTERRETTVRRLDVEAIESARVSIMPDGIEKLLGPADLADVIAFLSSLK